jgi:hypothetical protein
MTRKRTLLLIAAVLVVAVAAAAGLVLALRGNGGNGQSTVTRPPVGLASLYRQTRVGEKESDVLARWPKTAYQHYRDNLQDDCYEWQGENLYNLCFKNGVLALKTNF